MANESDIFVRFGADIDPLKKGVDKATTTLSQFGTSARKTTNQLGKLGVAATAAGAAIGIKFVNDSLDAIDSQAKLAKQLGTTTSSITTLQRAADMSGISMKNIESGAKNLEVALGEAAQGTGVAVDTLDRLGLAAQDLENLTLDEKILKVNQAIKENIPATEQAAAASDLFGKRAGFAISQLDSATIEEAKRQVVGFGVAVSDVDAAKIEAANDAMATVGMAVQGVSNQFTVTLAPILEMIANDFKEAAIQTGGFKEEGVSAVKAVATAIGVAADAMRGWEIINSGIVGGLLKINSTAAAVMALVGDTTSKEVQEARDAVKLWSDDFDRLASSQSPSDMIDAKIAQLTDERILDAKRNQVDALNEINKKGNEKELDQNITFAEKWEKFNRSFKKEDKKGTQQFFSDLATLTGSGNKRLFELGKIAARANVAIDTNESAMKAYKWAAGWGGPVAGGIAAGAAIAAGGIRLQAINSTSFGGGSSVSTGAASAAPAAASAPAAAAPQPQAQQVEISGINAGDMFTGEQLFGLIDKLNEAGEDGKTLNVSVA